MCIRCLCHNTESGHKNGSYQSHWLRHGVLHQDIIKVIRVQLGAPPCAAGGSDKQHNTAEARPIAVSRNGDSAAARTASEARCISACTVSRCHHC